MADEEETLEPLLPEPEPQELPEPALPEPAPVLEEIEDASLLEESESEQSEESEEEPPPKRVRKARVQAEPKVKAKAKAKPKAEPKRRGRPPGARNVVREPAPIQQDPLEQIMTSMRERRQLHQERQHMFFQSFLPA